MVEEGEAGGASARLATWLMTSCAPKRAACAFNASKKIEPSALMASMTHAPSCVTVTW